MMTPDEVRKKTDETIRLHQAAFDAWLAAKGYSGLTHMEVIEAQAARAAYRGEKE